jgi:drug/metabolite transporter (DMT)-like permease
MTAGTIAIAVACQIPLVAGQVLLKRAVGERSQPTPDHPFPSVPASPRPTVSASSIPAFSLAGFIAGIACLSLWFFLWLGLLQNQELSRIFPFEGLNPALMVIAAWLFLKERVPPLTWLGVALICAGIALVSAS